MQSKGRIFNRCDWKNEADGEKVPKLAGCGKGMEVRMKILDFGSLNYDYVYRVEHAVTAGETISSFDMEVFCGGKGLNQAIAAARAGAKVYLAGMVGTDGKLFMDICGENGVDTSCIRQMSGKSGHAIIQLDKKGQNCILLYGGTNQMITKEYTDEVLSDFGEGDVLLLQNEVNLLDYIIDRAYDKGMKIVLNPSPFDEKITACDLSKVSVFMLNEIEGEQVTGEKEPERILEALAGKFPEAEIVLTLGSNGVVYSHKDERFRQDIYKVETVDTTAAGDTFTGYFVASMGKGMDMGAVLRRCSKAAAIAVSRKGAVNSIPMEKEVDRWQGQ